MEIRKDYILERFVFIASERKKRRKEFKKHEQTKETGKCFFCPGNEETTPKEIGRIKKGNSWSIRWFPNKFPIVEKNKKLNLKQKKYFTSSPAYGMHEVIAETPDHKKQLWDLPEKQIKQLLDVYKNRIAELEKPKNIKYVQIFKNHGREAGTSLIHSHTQVVALPLIPSLVKQEIKATKNKCQYCDIIKIESKSKRKCFENKDFIAIAPFASRFNYECWIFPKKHIKRLEKLNDKETKNLAEILNKVLNKLKKLNLSYNYYVHYAPKGTNLHLHIEVTPRAAVWAGFEFSTDMIINSVSPEEAAKYYRS